MVGEGDEQQRLIREARMRKGKEVSMLALEERGWIKTYMYQRLGGVWT